MTVPSSYQEAGGTPLTAEVSQSAEALGCLVSRIDGSVERLYTCKEVAALTGRKPHTVKTLAGRYALTDHKVGRKIGRDWVFTENDLKFIGEIPARLAGRRVGTLEQLGS